MKTLSLAVLCLAAVAVALSAPQQPQGPQTPTAPTEVPPVSERDYPLRDVGPRPEAPPMDPDGAYRFFSELLDINMTWSEPMPGIKQAVITTESFALPQGHPLHKGQQPYVPVWGAVLVDGAVWTMLTPLPGGHVTGVVAMGTEKNFDLMLQDARGTWVQTSLHLCLP